MQPTESEVLPVMRQMAQEVLLVVHVMPLAVQLVVPEMQSVVLQAVQKVR